MNGLTHFLILCNLSILFIIPVELKFSEEYRVGPQDGSKVSKEITELDNNADDRWDNPDGQSKSREIEYSVNEAMQGDDVPTDNILNEDVTHTSVPTEENVDTGYSNSPVPDLLNEDIPKITSSTVPEVLESVNVQVTTEETTPNVDVTQSVLTSADDSDNIVEDAFTQTKTETEINQEPVSASNNPHNHSQTISVNKLSDQIKLVLQQYKKTGNVVVPNVKIPDPLNIPDMDRKMSLVSMSFKNQTVYGLSNFTVQHVNTDLDKMQVYVELHMSQLVVLGNYTMKSFLSRASGPFNVTLLNVTTEGAAALQYTPDGNLEASKTDMDMSFQNIKLDFKNLGLMGSIFQSVVGAVGNLIFEGIKGPIITEVNTKMKDDVNIKIRAMSSGMKANTSLSPVDQAILEGRRYIRDQGYDPYAIRNYSMNLAGLLKLNLTELTLNGLSRFYRVGEVSLSMDNGTVEFDVHLAADNITGNCNWSAGFGKNKIRDGVSSYVVETIQGRAVIKQSLDLDKPPQLADIDFRLGQVELKTNREDALDLIAESVVNNLPLLLRHIIVDGIELPIKLQAQKILDQVDVGSIVEKELPRLDEMGV